MRTGNQAMHTHKVTDTFTQHTYTTHIALCTTDSVLETQSFDRIAHAALALEVEDAFTKALDAELGANFLVNMVLKLDGMAMASDSDAEGGGAYAHK